MAAVVTLLFFDFVRLVFIGIVVTVVLLLALAALRDMGRYVFGVCDMPIGCYILELSSID